MCILFFLPVLLFAFEQTAGGFKQIFALFEEFIAALFDRFSALQEGISTLFEDFSALFDRFLTGTDPGVDTEFQRFSGFLTGGDEQ